MINDFPTFHNIKNKKHRNWNRLNVYWNIRQLLGKHAARKYLEQFDKKSKVFLAILANYITINGYENTRRELFRELNNEAS